MCCVCRRDVMGRSKGEDWRKVMLGKCVPRFVVASVDRAGEIRLCS